MKLLGLVGSMRKDGKTHLLMEKVFAAAKNKAPHLQTETLYLSDLAIDSCHACYDQCGQESYKCVVKDDFQLVLEKLKQADGFVLGSPLYFKIPSRLTAFMERLVILAFFHDTRGCSEPHLLYNKPCGIIAVAADGDPELVAEMLHRFVLSLRMKPMIKKTFPYLGVFSRGDISLDRNFSPLENSRELGEMLVMEMTKEK